MGTLSLASAKDSYSQQQAAPAEKKERTIFDYLTGDSKMAKAVSAVAGKHFTADRFLRLAVNAVRKTPLLMYCEPQSVLGAFMTSAALGLEPNTVLQQAFLLPYKKSRKVRNEKTGRDEWEEYYECNFQIGARGFVTLAHRSDQILTLQSEAIHLNDHFKHMLGTKSFLEYEKKLADRGEMIGAFCFTKMADNQEMATVLPLDEILKIRSKSETYNSLVTKLSSATSQKDKDKAQKKLDETPWVMWADDMAAKSATKKHAKQLPIAPSDALAVAAHIDGDDGMTIDMSSMANPDMVNAVMKEGVDAAATGGSGNGEAFGLHVEALENDPSPSLDTMQMRTATAETVDAQQASQEASPQQQLPIGDSGPSQFDKLKQRLETMSDIDALDVEADLISDIAANEEQAVLLRTVYQKRREELTNPAPVRQRRQMNLE